MIMALPQLALLPNYSLFKMLQPQTKSLVLSINSSSIPRTIKCKALNMDSDHKNTTPRRFANYQPSTWSYDYIQSLRSDYAEESYVEESDRLKEEVRMMLSKLANPRDQLELVDVLQRLGVATHFGLEIRNILEKVYNKKDSLKMKTDLYAVALEFRLLRQHGFEVSSDVFNGFQDEKGNFITHLSVDIKGMLSLYEASFHSKEGEIVLDEAKDFSLTYLKEFVNKIHENEISLLVSHALELPLHWRAPRLEARWFIDVYEGRQNMNPALLKLAKLDFNIVQVTHQEDLKHTSRWWKRVGLGEKLSFARDRLVENFFWTLGLSFQPRLGYFRRVMAKVFALITTIDDIYDVYGTLEELEIFTDVVERWDINQMNRLPDYMKICFSALHNFVNEVAFDTLKENGYDIIPYLKKAWTDLCKSYLVEAKWYYSEYTPSLQEYMENAWVSIGAPVTLVHAYFLLQNSIKKEDLAGLEEYSDIIRCSSTILRLANDLGTSKREMKTGDVPKSIHCYMNETGASEVDARQHVNSLICRTWKQINKEVPNSSYSQSFVEIAMNLGRMALFLFQHGDGHTEQVSQTENHIISILFQPIPIICTKN